MSFRAVARTLQAAMAVGLLVGCQDEPTRSTSRPFPTATVAVAATPTIAAAPSRTPTPSPPDLTPPPGGWIAFTDPSDRLVLTSMDGSRRVTLSELDGSVTWSPDGRWLLGRSTAHILALFSLLDGHMVTVADKAWGGGSWSQDSRFVAFVRQYTDVIPWRYELDLYEVASGSTITVTHQLPKYSEWTMLCGPPFPARFLMVFDRFEGVLRVYDRQSRELAAEFHADAEPEPTSSTGLDSMLLWLPDGEGVVVARQELDMKAIILAKCPPGVVCTSRMTVLPLSLAVWRAGDPAPRTVLKAQDRRRYWPEGWLPDGRLEVRQMDWERDEYEGSRAQAPESVQYRYFRMDADGELQEVEANNLPWWAGDGFDQRVQEAALPPGAIRPGYGTRSVSPDGRAVAFTWVSQDGSTSVYCWDGVGQPVRLGEGHSPQWQPTVPAAP